MWEAKARCCVAGVKLEGEPVEEVLASTLELMEVARWKAPADIGRQYAKVSGDYNPIHLSAVSAKLFGFPTAIAHGLWNKARTLAALSEHLPTANVEIAVQFRKPVRLPSEVTLLSSAAGSSGDFQLVGAGIWSIWSGIGGRLPDRSMVPEPPPSRAGSLPHSIAGEILFCVRR